MAVAVKRKILIAFLLMAWAIPAGWPISVVEARQLKRVMLDPGHGGLDAGVIGPGGLAEGRLVFNLALMLKQAIEKELGLQVILTREKDMNLSLAERTSQANGQGTDVFISLHAGGGPGSGPQVFVQNYGGQGGPGETSPPALLGPSGEPLEWTRAQSRHLNASGRLAEELSKSLNEAFKLKNKPVKAPLAVLAGADQPAALIEIGVLTNSDEEKRLSSQTYKDALTKALIQGIKAWRSWWERGGD